MYSNAGDITSIDDVLANVTYDYDYDNLHRLTEEENDSSAPATSAEIMTYSYDDPDHINAVTKINFNGAEYFFTYDGNGNMLTG